MDDVRVIWKVSIRRACALLQANRSTYHYVSVSPSQADLKKRIQARSAAASRRRSGMTSPTFGASLLQAGGRLLRRVLRYGYRRIHVLLRREGWSVNAKRVYRLYRELGLQLRNKAPKRKVKAKLREGRSDPERLNDVWAIDFVHDQLYDGTKIRVLTIIDAFTRYVPAIDVRRSYTGADVVDTLERVCAELGYPKSIRIDKGPEFISKDLDLWAYTKGVELDFSRPGKPTDNAFIESLNGKFRAADRIRSAERALVHEPCRCASKMRVLADRLQYLPATQLDWLQRPGSIDERLRGTQPTLSQQAEFSHAKWSKKWVKSTTACTNIAGGRRLGSLQ